MNILLVEDDVDLAFGLKNNLEIEGYQVTVAEDGRAALTCLDRDHYHVVILDLMIPGVGGLQVLRTMRSGGDLTPVVILTARDQEADKVLGLRLGADDYVTKPFGLLELLARLEALRRRVYPTARRIGRFTVGEVVIDGETREVWRRGAAVALSPKEFDLLWALAEAGGSALDRDTLMRTVWGYQGTVLSRTVDTHVAELRRKLEEDPAHPRLILTVRKVGYRLGTG